MFPAAVEGTSMETWYRRASDGDIPDWIPEEASAGDCFEAAGREVLFGGDPSAELCHGAVDGQGRLEGLRFGHAWVESGGLCIDLSRGGGLRLAKPLYYGLGGIRWPEVRRYSRQDARRMVLEHGRWGPWEDLGVV